MLRKRTILQKRGIHKESVYFKEFQTFSRKVRDKIYQLRQERKITQEQMQDYELNLRQFQRIENGDTKNVTLSYLFKIAKALKIKPAELIDV